MALARAQRAEARQERVAEKARARAAQAAADASAKADKASRETSEPTEPSGTRDAAAAEPHGVTERDAARQARRERAEARRSARRDKAADRSTEDDDIVEAPREPKAPLADKLRAVVPRRSAGEADPAPAPVRKSRSGRRLLVVLAGVVGALGLLCSVILALGALLVALGADGGGVYDLVSGICDVLVGPLRDVFSFSGTNAALKESLATWGAGAIGYLLIGIIAQSLLRSAAGD